MGVKTGNPAWQNTPAVSSPITAEALNAIEQAIDDSETRLVAGSNVTIDRSNPAAPIISSTGGGGGGPATNIIFVDDLSEIPAGTPVDTLVVLRQV